MRTNIVIDPALLDAAMRAGPYNTKKDAVEAGLRLLARQAAYREILRWEGRLPLQADGDAADAAEGGSLRPAATATVSVNGKAGVAVMAQESATAPPSAPIRRPRRPSR